MQNGARLQCGRTGWLCKPASTTANIAERGSDSPLPAVGAPPQLSERQMLLARALRPEHETLFCNVTFGTFRTVSVNGA
jgi:hypothetical protein